MPPVSQSQRAVMAAAASGHSSLGIPKSVGQEFMQADPGGSLPAHKPSSSLEAMTGLPSGKKRTRRGGGRHKSKPKVSAADHHKTLNDQMAKGDHAGAKISALHLAKALHASAKKQQTDDSAGKPSLAGDLTSLGL